ncbi:MAG: PhzF family phenazine biosynthesis protein [Stagnimonas sp.]|nr:PhzF family phenazine biosynthesis protein [Stagnimonas sp.]
MTATLPFHTLDVFTDTAFAGNPLAVVLEADGLNSAQMQQLAREFNLSETVFVLKGTRTDADVRVRIFTPATELPFAGHPTVGTACLLADLGWLPPEATGIVLEENVGLVPVRLVREDGQAWFGELTTAKSPETRDTDFDVGALPAVLGIDAAAITSVRLASCGNPFVVVTVRQPEVLQGIDFDATAARRLLANSWGHAIYIVAKGYEGEWRTRMFAPDLGVTEDPATGSAAVAFAGALALDALARGEHGEFAWTLHQGVEMGRPSLLQASASIAEGKVVAVRVGGHAVRVSEGRIRIPQ